LKVRGLIATRNDAWRVLRRISAHRAPQQSATSIRQGALRQQSQDAYSMAAKGCLPPDYFVRMLAAG
jgi:hypothetical protein